MQYHDINTDDQLRQYCRKLAHAKTIAFDTEFVSEHTYRPVLCLIQVAADDELAVIDPIDHRRRDAVLGGDCRAGPRDDRPCGPRRGRVLPAGHRPSAGPIVRRAIGGRAWRGPNIRPGWARWCPSSWAARRSKHETRTDWRRRPLSKRQIEYALDDARYLPPLRDTIYALLEELGRLAWIEEEMATWQDDLERSISQERWRRVSGNAGLDARGLAIVRELFHWRDAEAERRNQPPRRILRDDLIIELARRGSADRPAFRRCGGWSGATLRRRTSEIAAAMQRGLDLPEADCPPAPPREQVPELSVLGQLLFAAMGSICREAQLAPNLVGTPNDIREWILYRTGRSRTKSSTPPQLARGWRAEFVGRLFEDLLAGKLAIRVGNPKSDHPLVFEGPNS